MYTQEQTKVLKEIKALISIAVAIIVAGYGWCAFILPHKIPIGGVAGISSVISWGANIELTYPYVALNGILLLTALKFLGWRFCVHTIYSVAIFSVCTKVFPMILKGNILFADDPFLSCVVGGLLLGFGIGIALQYNASTGGSDVVAAMISKNHDVSLGKVILACDLIIISSGYFVLHNWENIIYGYITLFIMSATVDYVVNGLRGSVQFFVISEHWKQIGDAINNDVRRGCTLIDARGFYTGKELGMLFILARRSETQSIFRLISDIDPKAFVSQSAVNGVYGLGFEQMKVGKRKNISQTSSTINEDKVAISETNQ